MLGLRNRPLVVLSFGEQDTRRERIAKKTLDDRSILEGHQQRSKASLRSLDRYNEFHSQQMSIACSYPELVTEELKKYDEEVCKYFQVVSYT